MSELREIIGAELWWLGHRVRSFFRSWIVALQPLTFRIRHAFCGGLGQVEFATADGVTYHGTACWKHLKACVRGGAVELHRAGEATE